LADGAVVCDAGGTAVLATLVCEQDASNDRDFHPLQVDYRERSAAGGKIPSTFTRREGAPKDREILCARVVDRSLRPLFPSGMYNETQLIVNVLSADGAHDPDVLAINAASAALCVSAVPWSGPVGAVRVALIDGALVLHPRPEDLERAQLSVLYAGTETRTLMIEASATGDGVSTDAFAGALRAAHAAAALLVPPQRALAARVGVEKRAPPPVAAHPALLVAVHSHVGAQIKELFSTGAALDKAARATRLNELRRSIYYDPPVAYAAAVKAATPAQKEATFDAVCSTIVRDLVLTHGRRVDGRALNELRKLNAEAGVLPFVHGSALFERGDTQALATATIGGLEDAQRLDSLVGPASKRLMLHYGFPPFSVNETGKINQPSRREIGHGALAEKALAGSLPPSDVFPFAVRVNSETLASNGSSSMAAVCAGSMALMSAGVPLERHVGGISMGLIMEEDGMGQVSRYRLLTDIQGLEDHLGDIDWKLAGTRTGITAAQLDVKPAGVPLDILIEALQPAEVARSKVLDVLEAAISAPSENASPTAPRFAFVPVPATSLGRIIGPQGATIKEMERRTSCKISVHDDKGPAGARVSVFAPDAASMEAAQAALNAVISGGGAVERQLTGPPAEVGNTYAGKVVSLKDFGAFVELPNGEQGLLHVSEVSHNRVARVEDALAMNQEIQVSLLARENGKLRLSMKALQSPPPRREQRVVVDKRK